MRGRLLVIAVAAALCATPATAAPTSCRSVADEDSPGPASSLDIRRVDVAEGKKTVVVVLTLDTTDPGGEPARVLGYRWRVRVTTAGTTRTFERRRDAGPADTYRYAVDGGRTSVTASETRTQIKWVVPRSALPELRKPKVRLCAFADTTVAGTTADSAS
ncbi:MAG TPA: hypothetical protein VNQ77_19250 [Frankiaceae bacterium]|nr:hypothetical protein [Frankiaceae bacterium]